MTEFEILVLNELADLWERGDPLDVRGGAKHARELRARIRPPAPVVQESHYRGYFDGSGGDPAGIGLIIRFNGETLLRESRQLTGVDAPLAEYSALELLASRLSEMGVHKAVIYGDCAEVIDHLNGKCSRRPSDPRKAAAMLRIKQNLKGIDVSWRRVSRNSNKETDCLANMARKGEAVYERKEL